MIFELFADDIVDRSRWSTRSSAFDLPDKLVVIARCPVRPSFRQSLDKVRVIVQTLSLRRIRRAQPRDRILGWAAQLNAYAGRSQSKERMQPVVVSQIVPPALSRGISERRQFGFPRWSRRWESVGRWNTLGR